MEIRKLTLAQISIIVENLATKIDDDNKALLIRIESGDQTTNKRIDKVDNRLFTVIILAFGALLTGIINLIIK